MLRLVVDFHSVKSYKPHRGLASLSSTDGLDSDVTRTAHKQAFPNTYVAAWKL